MSEPTGKKIIIDEDWKEEAQREKEQLAESIEREQQRKRQPPAEANFAGEATAGDGIGGTVDAALESGRRAAGEILSRS